MGSTKVFPISNDPKKTTSKKTNHTHIDEEDAMLEIEQRLHRKTCIKRVLAGIALVGVGCIGVLMCVMMWIATKDEDVTQGGTDGAHPAPYWLLIFLLWAGMLICSILLGFAFSLPRFRNRVRGSLEYTTLNIYDLRGGQCYAFEEHLFESAGETSEERICREKHQLLVEAGLAGWSEEMIQEQIASLTKAKEARGVYREQEAQSRTQVVVAEARKLLRLVTNTLKAKNIFLSIVVCIFAILTVGVGALGAFLTIKIAHMPDPDDDPLWIERSWQLINAIFSIIAVWKGPQRVLLLYHWFRQYWVQASGTIVDEHDGTKFDEPRSLLVPGVLLTQRKVGIIASLRMANVVCQYIVCFFMWAWLPRCLEENKEQKQDCTSRPAWGVPVFLVLGMGTDIASNAILSSYIASCEYNMWPIKDKKNGLLVYHQSNVDGLFRHIRERSQMKMCFRAWASAKKIFRNLRKYSEFKTCFKAWAMAIESRNKEETTFDDGFAKAKEIRNEEEPTFDDGVAIATLPHSLEELGTPETRD